MGKGNRNSQKRAQDQAQNAEQLLAMQKAKNKKSFRDKAVTITIAVIALVVVGTLLFSALANTGIFLRNTSAMESESITVDSAMMSFFLNESIISFYSQYALYIQYGLINVDFTQDLKTQQYNASAYLGSFSGSWYDYFMKPVKAQVEEYIVYATAAKKVTDKDLSLTEDEKKVIEDKIKNLSDSLSYLSLTFSDVYGKGVKESDVRRCYELKHLAEKFEEYIIEQLEGKVQEDEIVDYREANKSRFYTADCLTYSIKVVEKLKTQQEYDADCEEAKNAADKIAGATSPEEFIEYIKEYEASLKDKDEDESESESGSDSESDESVSETETETETESVSESESASESETEKDISEELEKYKETIKYQDGKGNKLNDFLFGNDETGTDSCDAAEEGDATVIEETGEETAATTTKNSSSKSIEETESDSDSDSEESESESEKRNDGKKYKTYTVTVYYVIDPMHYDTELTHNFAYLISDIKANVVDFSLAFKTAEGDKTGKLFVELAEKKHNDLHESEGKEHSDSEVFWFNNLEKQSAGWFNTNGGTYYKDMDTWIESADRKNGDVSDVFTLKVVSTDSAGNTATSTQYAIVFFESHGEETWYVTAFDGAVAENLDEWYQDWLKTNTLKVSDAVNNVDTKKSYTVLTALASY